MAIAVAAVYDQYDDLNGTSSLTTASITPSGAGDILVAFVGAADVGTTIGLVTDTGQGLTWTSRANYTTASHCAERVFTATTTSGTALTVTAAYSGTANRRGLTVLRITGGALAGSPVTSSQATTGAPSYTSPSIAAGSLWCWSAGDWNAITGTLTLRSSATTDTNHQLASQWCQVIAHQTAAGGANTYGQTAPTGQASSSVGIEILVAGGGGGATATPGVVTAPTTIPTPAVSGSARVTPAVVAVGTTIPTPAPHGSAGAAPAVVAVSMTIPTPAPHGAATATPAAVAATTSIPTPVVPTSGGHSIFTTQTPASSITGDGDVTLGTAFTTDTADPITSIRYWRGGTANDGVTINVALYDAIGSTVQTGSHVQSSGDGVGWVTVTLAAPVTPNIGVEYVAAAFFPGGNYVYTAGELTAAINNPPLHSEAHGGRYGYNAVMNYPPNTSDANYYLDVIQAAVPDATATPAVVAVSTSIPTPTVTTTGSANVHPAVVAVATTIPTPTVSTAANANAHPAVVAVVATIPTLVGSQSATTTPGVVAATAAIPTPTVTTAVNANAAPAVVAVTTTIPTPGVAAGGNVNITPGVVAVTTSIPAPAPHGSAVATPTVVAAATAIPTPIVTTAGNANVLATVVSVGVTIPTPAPKVGVTVRPAVVAARATIPTPAVGFVTIPYPVTGSTVTGNSGVTGSTVTPNYPVTGS